uniref:Cation-dependent mannose-6-phosphate receptor n=1 Tax=Scylla olivacea TaxID=85551 RepID=A0A0P4VUQ4_SCYOL
MAGMMKTLLVVMVVAMPGLELTRAECTVDPSVKAESKLEQEKLLQTLSPIIGQRSGEVQDKHDNTYEFAVCSDLPNLPGVSLAQTGKTPVPLGYNNQTLVSSDKHWLMLTFLGGPASQAGCNGSHWQGHVVFICDHDQDKIEMKVLDDPNFTLKFSAMFVVRHRSICSLSQKGLSGGAIFFILLLVSFSLYFTFGFLYLRLVRGAKGVEQIPNRNFWFRVGNLLADGCETVFRCDRYCGAGERPSSSYSGYSPIDEQLAQDLQDGDRDSALLSP